MKDYYKILGVEEDADIKTIYKKCYDLMSLWHPSKAKDIECYGRFIEIYEAYEILRDPERRYQYNLYRSHCQQAKALGEKYYRMPLEEVQNQVMKDVGQMILEFEPDEANKESITTPPRKLLKTASKSKVDINDPKTKAILDELKEEFRKDLRSRRF